MLIIVIEYGMLGPLIVAVYEDGLTELIETDGAGGGEACRVTVNANVELR